MATRRMELAAQDEIVDYDDLARDFLATILDLDLDETFISDLSSLSDFSGCGMPPADSGLPTTLAAYNDCWDRWVIGQIEARYHLTLPNTTLRLTALFDAIEAARRRPLS